MCFQRHTAFPESIMEKKHRVFSNPLEERRLPGGGVRQRLQHKALTGKVRGCRAAGQASEVQMKPLAQRWQPEEPGLARIRGVLSFQVPPCAGCGDFRLPQTRLCESNTIALICLASAGCAVSIPPPDLPKTRAHVKPREERNFLSRVNKPILITTSLLLRSPLRSLLRSPSSLLCPGWPWLVAGQWGGRGARRGAQQEMGSGRSTPGLPGTVCPMARCVQLRCHRDLGCAPWGGGHGASSTAQHGTARPARQEKGQHRVIG